MPTVFVGSAAAGTPYLVGDQSRGKGIVGVLTLGDDGALSDANDELRAARADAPGNGGDGGKSVAAQALPLLDGVGPTDGRSEPRLAAKALINRGGGDFEEGTGEQCASP